MRISTIIFIVLLVAASIILVFHLEKMGYFDVKCSCEDRVMLKGVLLGFSRNESFRQYTNVRLQIPPKVNATEYVFYRIDKDLLKSFIGLNVQIDTCCCVNTSSSVKIYYDFISVYATGE